MNFGKTAIYAALALFLFYAVLIISLLTFFEGKGFLEVLLAPDTLFSIRLSLVAATLAMLLAVVVRARSPRRPACETSPSAKLGGRSRSWKNNWALL